MSGLSAVSSTTALSVRITYVQMSAADVQLVISCRRTVACENNLRGLDKSYILQDLTGSAIGNQLPCQTHLLVSHISNIKIILTSQKFSD